jgi:hypothetical protein
LPFIIFPRHTLQTSWDALVGPDRGSQQNIVQNLSQELTRADVAVALLTWQPTPMNSSFFTVPARASTVAKTSRLGLNVGFTPLDAKMSSGVRATTGRGLNLTAQGVVSVKANNSIWVSDALVA